MEKLPQRKTPRAQWIEYNAGLYFITICTHNWVHYFGEIELGKISLTKIGEYLESQIEVSNNHHPYINVIQYVVMPNHFHAIVEVTEADVTGHVPTWGERKYNKTNGKKPLLSIYVASLKSSITRYANKRSIKFKWQSRYHDHLTRGIEDCNNISQYIDNNILKWEEDCYNK